MAFFEEDFLLNKDFKKPFFLLTSSENRGLYKYKSKQGRPSRKSEKGAVRYG